MTSSAELEENGPRVTSVGATADDADALGIVVGRTDGLVVAGTEVVRVDDGEVLEVVAGAGAPMRSSRTDSAPDSWATPRAAPLRLV